MTGDFEDPSSAMLPDVIFADDDSDCRCLQLGEPTISREENASKSMSSLIWVFSSRPPQVPTYPQRIPSSVLPAAWIQSEHHAITARCLGRQKGYATVPSPETTGLWFCKLIGRKGELTASTFLQNLCVFWRSNWPSERDDKRTIDGNMHVYECRFVGPLKFKLSETLGPRRIARSRRALCSIKPTN